jgi:hypothetical protein
MKIPKNMPLKSGGKATENPEQPKASFTLKTACRELTVRDYIEIVCYDNYARLIVEGEPDSESLQIAVASVLSEFAILSGNSKSEISSIYSNINIYRAKRLIVTVALNLVQSFIEDNMYAEINSMLGDIGIFMKPWDESTHEINVKRLKSQLTLFESKLQKEIERYNRYAEKNKNYKQSEIDVRMEMVIIGNDSNQTISDDCNLATYAVQKKMFVERLRSLEANKALGK